MIYLKWLKYVFLGITLLIFPLNVFADSASSTIVMDLDSGRVLYSKNADSKRLIASITKIMTCIVTLENAKMDTMVTIGDEVLDMYGTNIYIEPGEEMSIKDLVYGLMLRSGNDAAVVLAKNVFGSEEKFVGAMNKKAKEIGMINTIFKNPHGLDEKTKNYSTARDMMKLSRYAYSNKDYLKIIGTRKYTCKSSMKSYVWYNRMSLLANYKRCVGGKNGYTPEAGKTLVSLARDKSLNLSIVTLNDSDLYENHERLYEKYFSKYKSYTIVDKDNFRIDSNFVDGEIYINKSFNYPLREDELSKVSTVIEIDNKSSKDIVGKVIIRFDKEEIGSIDIFRKVEKKEEISLFQKFKNLFIR